jgi:hypothetical protein
MCRLARRARFRGRSRRGGLWRTVGVLVHEVRIGSEEITERLGSSMCQSSLLVAAADFWPLVILLGVSGAR